MYPLKPWTWRRAVSTPLDILQADDSPQTDEEKPTCGWETGYLGRVAVGYWVKAADGFAGYVDEASADVGEGLLVVDTVTLVFGRRVLIPIRIVDRVDHAGGAVYVASTKNTIKSAPTFDRSALGAPEYRKRIIDHFGEPP